MFKRLINNWNKFWFDFRLYRTLCAAESLRKPEFELEAKPKVEREPKSTIELIADTIDFIPSKGCRLIDLEVEIYRSIQSDREKAEYQQHVQSLVRDCARQSDLCNDISLGYVELDDEIDTLSNFGYINETPKNQRSRLTQMSMVLRPIDYISYHYVNSKRDICGVILKIEMSGGEYSEVTINCLKDDKLLIILKSLGLPEVPLPNQEYAVYYDDDPIIFSRNSDGTITRNKEHKLKQP